MNNKDEIKISEIDLENEKENQIKPKKIEWLNIFSKGFIVESINNNYKNQNVNIKKHKNSSIKRNIIPRNFPTFIFKQGFTSNFNNSNLSSRKTNFTLLINDEEDFKDKNKLLSSISNISNINDNYTERNNKKDNCKKEIINNKKKNYTDKKEIKTNKSNSVKNMKLAIPQKNLIKDKKIINYKNNNNNAQKNKRNTKIKIKKDIHSPLLNYLESNKNKNPIIFNLINNKNNNKTLGKINNNTNINSYKDTKLSKTEKKKHKIRYSKSIKEIKINNVSLIEIQRCMIEGRKFKNQNNRYGYNNDYKGDLGDYSFDNDENEDKFTISERNNRIALSDICNPMNSYMTNNKNEINAFLEEIIKKENQDNKKLDKMKYILGGDVSKE